MKLGTAKAIITPPIGTPLAGFASRVHGSEGIADDLEVRALWFQESEATKDAVCIITADLLGIDETITAEIRSILSKETGIPKDRILLAASHTHSGQQTLYGIVATGDPIPEVVEMTKQRILEAARESCKNLRSITIHVGKGELVGYATNRRLFEDGELQFAPNLNGIRDDEVTVISCRDESNGDILAAMFHYTCHPSTICTYNITGDYPGEARRYIESKLGNGAIATFIPGCFGNIRTNATIVGGKDFREGTPQDVKAFGEALGCEVMKAISKESVPLTPYLTGAISDIDLAFSKLPSQEELETASKSDDPTMHGWAAKLLSKPFTSTGKFSIQRINLAKELMLVAMSGEVVCEYGHYIKELHPEIFAVPMGYSNGDLSYIPTAAIIAEGGYEGDRSHLTYGLPSPFKPEIENQIKDTIQKLMD